MSSHLIQESRISSQRFYTVMRESKIKFYTTSVAAARYWIKNCSEAPPLHSNGKAAPKYVVVKRVPVRFHEDFEPQARA